MGRRKDLDLDELISSATENVNNDRSLAFTLLTDLMKRLNKDDSMHRDLGQVAAKYMETLQRSNEQLVKLCGLMSKQEKTDELSEKDFAQIFDQIQQSESE